jgi:DNA-binding response OmpR family regulator
MHGSTDGAQGHRLLIVDESRLVLETIYDFLTPHGWVVNAAPNVRKALDLLEDASCPEIIVTEIVLPDRDGWRFFEILRRQPRYAEIPVVILTTETDLATRLRGFQMGAHDYITKPFDVEELHARITRILDGQAALVRARETGDDALLAGSVEHLGIADLLQILSLNNKSGRVELKDGRRQGRIVFEGGKIVHAECRGIQGEKAIYRMLGWTTATFRLVPLQGEGVERTVQASTSNVLMDGLVSLDEWNRWEPMMPPEEFRIEMAPESESRLDGHDATRAEVEVMRRAKGGPTVGDILDQSPLPDAELAEALCALLTRDVIRTRE